MMEGGEPRLPEMQRRYVWRSSCLRDLLGSPGCETDHTGVFRK